MIGGIGSIPGALAGGLVLGFAESYTQGYISTRWSDLFVFVLLILFLSSGPRASSAKRTSGRCEMSGGYDDELTRPLEGALEASTSEGPTSPAVGRDEWVARHGDNRTRRGGRSARSRSASASSPGGPG